MTWLAWRQFRWNAALGAVLTLVVVVVLLLTRGAADRMAAGHTVDAALRNLRLLGTVLIAVPAFIGAFWGAPLVARELEQGTAQLAWTQSVTRSRWLAVKLVVIGAAAAVVTACFSLVFTWWSAPFDVTGNRVGTANFGQRGVAPIAYAVFALALGTLLGIVIRRTVPAIAGTLTGFLVVRFAFQGLVRPHLLGTVDVTVPTTLFGTPVGQRSEGWVVSRHVIDASGRVVTPAQVERAIRTSCRITRTTRAGDLAQCARDLRIRDVVVTHPASQFWQLQLVEGACFLALAAVLVGLSFWWINRRTA